MTADNRLDNFFITPAINKFTLIYYENNYNLWFEDTIIKTIENVNKPTKRLSNKLLINFPDYINTQNDFPGEVNELYNSISKNMSRRSDGFKILKDLFQSILQKDKKIENLKNSSDKIRNTYFKESIGEKSSSGPLEAIKKLLEDNYTNSIEKLNNNETKTIYIDCDILKKYNIYSKETNNNDKEKMSLFSYLEKNPNELIETFDMTLSSFLNPDVKEYYIKFDYHDEKTKLNDLLSDKLGTFIKTTGVVKGLYKIIPYLKTGVFECKKCMKLYEVDSNEGAVVEPNLCDDCGHRNFRLLKKESVYYNSRKLLIEEPIEDLGNKTNPRNILAVTVGDGDFINKINIGDRVDITGILSNYKDNRSNEFNFYIDCNNIEKIGDLDLTISEEEEKEIIELSKDKNIFKKLIDSSGFDLELPDEIKISMLCSIVGGGYVSNGRSEIHSLLITNPGFGKSDLFEWVASIVEKCIMTSGASSSGVGLTGAIDKDPITGQNVLKAGALPLASGGICIGDELDKLNRKAFGQLNNMIEKGKENFNKGGINETLYCKATFIGGANPKYERFDKYKSMKDQIVFPASFLSRMDTVFVVKDDPDEEIVDPILDRYTGKEIEVKENEIDSELLKKYLYYAKHNFKPVLTEEGKKVASEYIKKVIRFYSSTDLNDVIEFTRTRFVNSIARLGGAIAKLHLRNEITKEDIEKVIALKNYCFKLMGFDIENNEVNPEIVNGEVTSNKQHHYQTIFDIITEEKEKEESVYLMNYGVAKQYIKSKFVEITNASESTCNKAIKELFDNNRLSKNRYGQEMYYDIMKI